MRLVPFFLLCTVLISLGAASAQGSIAGTLHAPDVRGYLVIACHIDAAGACDEARSDAAVVSGSGGSGTFEIVGLAAGDYLLLAWLDANGNGEAEESELSLLLDTDGAPLFFRPPAQGVLFAVGGASAPADPSGPGTNPIASNPLAGAALPAELVGIWQQTRASSGDYRNTVTGAEFTSLTGFSVRLILHENGVYEMEHFTSGVLGNCAVTVTYFDQSAGWASLEGNVLTLRPSWRFVDTNDCNASVPSMDMGTEPVVYHIGLSEEADRYGLRSHRLALEGQGQPLNLEILHREPLMPGYQPAQPADFVLGGDPMFREFIGTWSPHPHSDLGFFDPVGGDFYLPEQNGASHQWLRFDESGYELATAWKDYNDEGVCTKDYVYFERGRTLFSITDPPQYEGGDTLGHLRTQATSAQLIVNIRDCDEHDRVLRYDLVPQSSYYVWRYRQETHDMVFIPEGFNLRCPWAMAEWQFMVCSDYDRSTSYMRR